MKERGLVLGSFIGDSLALGVHWIYDIKQIPEVRGLLEPKEGSYHATKKKGQLTHIGDQTLVLLESIADASGFDLMNFGNHWRAFFDGYKGYFDHATKESLKNFNEGKDLHQVGSYSNELAGVARMAPVVYFYRDQFDKMLSAVREQTSLTHHSPINLEAAEYFGQVMWEIMHGASPSDALNEVPAEENLSEWMEKAKETVDQDTPKVIKTFGQHCGIEGAFPSVCHLIMKYEEDYEEALIQNVMAGGDSATRGLLVGMMLGAYHGPEAIPKDWLENFEYLSHIDSLLEAIDHPRVP